jgi:hypothetical protein
MGDASTTTLDAIISRSSRRRFVASAAPMPVALGAMLTVSAEAPPEASQQSGVSTQPFLTITDRAEPTLWFYSIPDCTLIGKLDSFLMASHASGLICAPILQPGNSVLTRRVKWSTRT